MKKKSEWTAKLYGQMYIYDIDHKQLARYSGYARGYVTQILDNGDYSAEAEEILKQAIALIIEKHNKLITHEWIADIVARMHLNGITRIDLAKKLGVSRNTLTNALRGRRKKTTKEELMQAINEITQERSIDGKD